MLKGKAVSGEKVNPVDLKLRGFRMTHWGKFYVIFCHFPGTGTCNKRGEETSFSVVEMVTAGLCRSTEVPWPPHC